MAFDSTPQSTEYSASSYALDSIDNAISRDEYDPSCSDDISSLRLQASRLEHLLQVMPAGVIVIDGKGIVRQANEQAKALLGEPLEEEVWRSIITRSFKPRADDGHEVSLVDGRRVKLSITPLENEPGQLIVITDLNRNAAAASSRESYAAFVFFGKNGGIPCLTKFVRLFLRPCSMRLI